MSVFILGGGYGSLGEQIALRFIQDDQDFQDDQVIIFDKNRFDLSISEDGIEVDVTSEHFWFELLEMMEEYEPSLIVNLVGMIDFEKCESLDLHMFQEILRVNLMPLANCAKAISLYSKSTSFIQIGSNSASYPFSGMFSYCTAKSAQKQAIKILAKEVAPRTRVNMINPGPFYPGSSGMSDYQVKILFDGDKQKAIDSMEARIPMGKLCTPQDLYDAINWVTNTPQLTGQVIELSGGQIL